MFRLVTIISTAALLAYGYSKLQDGDAVTLAQSSQRAEPAQELRPGDSSIDLAALKKTVDRAAALQNSIAGASAVVAATCAMAKQTACAAISSGISGATWLGSAVTTQAALDLNDMDFTKIAAPDGQHIDIGKLPPSTQAIVTTIMRANDLANAVTITANRAIAAVKAGDSEWFQRQIEALQKYQDQIGPVSQELASNLASYAAQKLPEQGKISTAMAALQSEATALEYTLQANIADLKTRAFLSCLLPPRDDFKGYVQKAACGSMSLVR